MKIKIITTTIRIWLCKIASDLIEITSSTSEQNAKQSCPSPIVYFPLLTLSWASKASCSRITQPHKAKHQKKLKIRIKISTFFSSQNSIRNNHNFPPKKKGRRRRSWCTHLLHACGREVDVHGKDSHILGVRRSHGKGWWNFASLFPFLWLVWLLRRLEDQ